MANEALEFYQVQLQFIAEEDRFIFRLNSTNDQQFSMWFTRRFVKELWPVLFRLLATDTKIVSYDNASQQAAFEFQHEAAMKDADYEKEFKTKGLTYPWGKKPLLAAQILIKEDAGKNVVLGIFSSKGIGFEFSTGHKVLHYLYQGLENMLPKIGWEISLEGQGPTNISIPKEKLN